MQDQSEQLSSVEQPLASDEAPKWVNQSIDSVAKANLAARDRVLAQLTAQPSPDQTGEWEWSVDTLRDLQTALNARLVSEQTQPGLNATLFEGATQAFRKFIHHVPLLHVADPTHFEGQLSEFFAEAMQNADERVRLVFANVCMKAFDHWFIRDLHGKFVTRTIPSYTKRSPFREEILKWCEQSKDEVKNKKATFPIMDALAARLIEINTVLKPTKAQDIPPFHDDWLIEEVEKVCATSKPFVHDLFGLGIIKIDTGGGFNHIRTKLIEINERRKMGQLHAHSYTDFEKVFLNKEELLQFVKVLLIAFDKLSDQLEASQITLSQTLGSERADKQKLIKAHEKTNQELRKHLAVEIANSADKSRIQHELQSTKDMCLEQQIQIQRLIAERDKEKQLRAETQVQMGSLHLGYQNKMGTQESAHATILEEERRTFEAVLAEERHRSKVALEEQRRMFEAKLVELSPKNKDAMTTPKKSYTQDGHTKPYFFDASPRALTDVDVVTAPGPERFSMTLSPNGSDVSQ